MENPTISAANKKTKTIGCKVTQAEYDEFYAKAKEANMTVSNFFRLAVIANETWIVQRPVVDKDKKLLTHYFGKASNNLNQIAHSLNTANLAGNLSNTECHRAYRELQLIRSILLAELDQC